MDARCYIYAFKFLNENRCQHGRLNFQRFHIGSTHFIRDFLIFIGFYKFVEDGRSVFSRIEGENLPRERFVEHTPWRTRRVFKIHAERV